MKQQKTHKRLYKSSILLGIAITGMASFLTGFTPNEGAIGDSAKIASLASDGDEDYRDPDGFCDGDDRDCERHEFVRGTVTITSVTALGGGGFRVTLAPTAGRGYTVASPITVAAPTDLSPVMPVVPGGLVVSVHIPIVITFKHALDRVPSVVATIQDDFASITIGNPVTAAFASIEVVTSNVSTTGFTADFFLVAYAASAADLTALLSQALSPSNNPSLDFIATAKH